MGYSTDEMEVLFSSDEFFEWYHGRINDNYTFYYKKNDIKPDMLNVSFERKDSVFSLVLPTNLVASQPMDLAFLKLFTRYSAVADYNFDNLFVPFRCMATDVYNNNEVVLKDGDLGQAVRASMTFPFYFKPISIDGNLLFDGGIVNNFPEDVMRQEFKPDFIIGSKVASANKKPKEDKVIEQIESLIMFANTKYEIAPENGILIANEFEDVSLLDFNRLTELRDKGYNSTMMLMDSIRMQVKRRVPLDTVNVRREKFKEKLPDFILDNIYIEGVNVQQEDYIRNSLKQNKRLLNFEQFEEAYYKLIVDNQIESAMPLAVYNKATGYFDMTLKVKQEQPYHVMLGAQISSTSTNQAFVGIEYKLLSRRAYYFHANVHFGSLYTSFQALTRVDVPWKHPFYMQLSGSNNRWDFFKSSSKMFFVDVAPAYLIQNDNNVRFDIGLPLGNKSKLEFGGAYAYMRDDYYQTNSFLKTDTVDVTGFELFTTHLRFEKNTLNHKMYPTSGVFDKVDLRYVRGKETNNPGTTSAETQDYGDQHSYFMLKMKSDRYHKLSKHYALGTYIEMVASNKTFYRNYISTLLSANAFCPTPHSRTLFLKNFRANSYAAFGLKNIFKITDVLDLRVEGYAFMPLWKIDYHENQSQLFNPYYDKSNPYLYFTSNANLVYNTPVGPVSLSVNYYEEESSNWYFLFHFGYLIFNERGLD
jgi:NTE family protein